jgi:hypothetical protein
MIMKSSQQRGKRLDLGGLAAVIGNDLLQRFTNYSPCMYVRVKERD